MRSRLPMLVAAAILALILSACGAMPTPAYVVSSTPVAGFGSQTDAIPATGATATLAAPATSAPAPTQGTPGTAGSGTSLVTITSNLKYGALLADGSGKTLYLFTKDTPNTPACYGGCASAWPPFLASSGTPGVGTGLDPSKLGTAVRSDGKTQVTYNGWPLYYFAKDTKAGEVNGQGFNGAWYAVSPTGNPIK